MDKKEAMKRLDAIEASIKDMKDEATKLREIIEALEKVERWRPKKPTLCWVWDEDKRPVNAPISIVTGMRGCFYATRLACWKQAVPLTRAEALAMVDAPSRYPWDEMPKWMKWAATDKDGRSYGYQERPEPFSASCKWTTNGEYELIGVDYSAVCFQWYETLEARPE